MDQLIFTFIFSLNRKFYIFTLLCDEYLQEYLIPAIILHNKKEDG